MTRYYDTDQQLAPEHSHLRLVDIAESGWGLPAAEVMAMVENRQAWGAQLLVDMAGCNPTLITSAAKIADYAVDLCRRIGMKAYGEPQVPLFGLADPKTVGRSLVQLIETSLIDAHFSASWGGLAVLNVHSCNVFDVAQVVGFTAVFFEAYQVRFTVLPRGIHR